MVGPDRGAVVRVFKAQIEEMGGALALSPVRPEGFSDGDVGWLADQPTLRMADGSELAFWITAVLVRDAGAWRFQQVHFSLGVANEQVVGRELTTEASTATGQR